MHFSSSAKNKVLNMNSINNELKIHRNLTIALSLIGLLLSWYTVSVAEEKIKNPNYKAICDISDRFSCSPVFASPFGKGFGVVDKILGKDSFILQLNGVYGYLLYGSLIILGFLNNRVTTNIQMLSATCGGIASTYGFINAFYISPYLCIVCLIMHSINYILIIVTYFKLGLVYKLNQNAKNKRQ